MKKLKILLVTQTYPPTIGGISTYVFKLEQSLKCKGHKILVLNYDGRNNSLYKKVKPRDIFYTPSTFNEYYNFFKLFNPFLFSKLGGFKDFVFQNMIYREAEAAIKEFKPDLIYLLNAKLYSTVYDLKVPYVLVCYSEEIKNTFPIRYSLNHANKIICITRFTANLVSSIIPNRKNDIEVVYTGIDLDKYQNLKLPRKNQIITLCRLDKRKNVESIIKAYSMLPKIILENYNYLIVGSGDEKTSLEKLVKELKLNNKIKFMDAVDEKTKIRLLAESKLYVMCPTTYFGEQEGFGITFIEAQAAGLPTIGSNIGGATEAIGNGGLIVKDEMNPNEIASKMSELILNSKLYQQCLNNINSRISEFNSSTWIKKTEKLLYQALDS